VGVPVPVPPTMAIGRLQAREKVIKIKIAKSQRGFTIDSLLLL
jgi:hypothetical protein